MNNVLIIGNGFDLDLGLSTRYSDFYKSSYWPFSHRNTPLAKFLENKFEINDWLDVEEALAEYSKKTFIINTDASKYDEADFDTLKNSFNKYILREQESFEYKESIASRLLAAVLDNGYFEDIFSFNFTDLNFIAKDKLGIKKKFDYSHVHGKAVDGTAILGVGDYADVREEDDFMYKSFAKSYSPPLMIPTLLDANRVIIFGMSLGKVDYQYFDDFFKRVIVGYADDSIGDCKDIIIFTYNEISRRKILRNLQNMTGNKLGRLYTRSNFRIYCTAEGIDECAISELIKDLKVNSRVNRERKMRLRYH